MANFYGKNRDTDFAASKLMSFGKSFSRMNGQPLDESEVWYNKADLEAFAAGNSAYVGMKLVYVDETNQKVYQYSVQYDGTIKEIGVAPLGDNKSIQVDAETGTVSLKGINALVFERDIVDENDQPTGEKEAIQYQPLMTAAGLVWVEPSKTTVEGLATLIEALTTRVSALEGKVGAAAKPESAEGADDGVPATGLYALIEAEAARAIEAEEALDAKIGEKAKPETTEGAGDAKEATGVYKYVDDEIAGLEEVISNLNHFTAKIVTSTDEVTETGVLYLIKDTEVAGNDKYNEYLYIEGQGAVLIGDTTTDLSQYSTTDEMNKAISDAITDANLDQYTTEEEVNGLISTAIGTPGVPAQGTEGEEGYVAPVPGTGIHTNIYSKSETDAQIAAAVKSATGGTDASSVLAELNAYKTSNNTRVGNVEDRVGALEEIGAQANVIEAVVAKTGNTLLDATKIITADKTVTIDDSAIVDAIALAKKAGDDANTAAQAAQTKANTNEGNINTLIGRMNTAEGNITNHATTIGTHTEQIAALQGTVEGHTEAIGKKADQTALNATNEALGTLQGTVGGHTTAIATLQETSQTKADAKTEHDAIIALIGAPTAGETPATGVYIEIEKKADKATTLAGYGIADAYTKDETDTAIATAVANAGHLKREVVNTLPTENIDTNTIYMVPVGDGADIFAENIYNEYMYLNGAWEKIGTTETDLRNYATIDYVDNAIGNIPLATLVHGENDAITATAGLIKPTADKFEITDGEVSKISTDLLVNGSIELVLNGGNATN